MARSTMEVAFLSVQKTEFDDVKIVKLFYGDEPDGKTEHGLSIIGMGVSDEVADEVFSSCAGLEPLEAVRITFDVARGGKNLGKNLALHIEPVKPKTASAQSSGKSTPAPQADGAKP